MNDEGKPVTGAAVPSGVVTLGDLKRLRRAPTSGAVERPWEPAASVPQVPRPSRQSTRSLIAHIPGIVAELRRDGGRVTKKAVYARLEVDASTLNEWIDRGYVDWKSLTKAPPRPK